MQSQTKARPPLFRFVRYLLRSTVYFSIYFVVYVAVNFAFGALHEEHVWGRMLFVSGLWGATMGLMIVQRTGAKLDAFLERKLKQIRQGS